MQMYGDVVMGVQKRAGEDHEPFESVIEQLRTSATASTISTTSKLSVADLKELVRRFKELIKERTGKSFPSDPWRAALGLDRRRLRFVDERPRDCLPAEIRHPAGMGHGRECADDGLRQHRRQLARSGVAFTRDPASGEKVFYGEFLINAQGEDVVAGVRTPQPVAD